MIAVFAGSVAALLLMVVLESLSRVCKGNGREFDQYGRRI